MSSSNNRLTNKGRVPRFRVSAGLLMFRRRAGEIEFLLVHPGGPFFLRKDAGAWSIPKGEAAPAEDLLARAVTEFAEELGFEPHGDWLPLGTVRQRGGKTIHAWAFEGDLPNDFTLRCNQFELEWPPGSRNRQTFPEIDRAEFFSAQAARVKINQAQAELLDRLLALLPSRALE